MVQKRYVNQQKKIQDPRRSEHNYSYLILDNLTKKNTNGRIDRIFNKS